MLQAATNRFTDASPQVFHHVIDDSQLYHDDRDLSFTPAFDAPVGGGGRCRNIVITFDTKKLEWFGYPMVKNIALSCTFLSCLTLNNIVTLKSGLEVIQGHSNWYH